MEQEIKRLGKRVGFGFMMKAAQAGWRECLKNWKHGDISGGEFIVGPCVVSTVPCVCMNNKPPGSCDYCCGCGWLTKAVKELLQNKESV
jgi:hypothetical protein